VVKLPKLFVELESQRTPREQRAYIADELVRMIQDGSLSMVAVMNQRPAARQIAGDVIFGHGVSDGQDGFEAGSHVTNKHIPAEIKRATVTLEAIGLGEDGKPRNLVRWVDGSVQSESIVVGSASQHDIPTWEHNWVEADSPATVSLRDAWLALKRYGEHVVSAHLPQDKKDLWQCREVAGSVKDGTRRVEPAKRGKVDEARV
jgi:hypothetical protein